MNDEINQMNFPFAEPSKEEITVKALENLSQEIAMLRDISNDLNNQKKKNDLILDQKEAMMIEYLNSLEKESYHSSAGTVSLINKLSVKVPSTPEDKQAFLDYLKGKGVFESMVTVNSMTLNAFYKAELERAASEGQADFQIPGLNNVTAYTQLSFRKK